MLFLHTGSCRQFYELHTSNKKEVASTVLGLSYNHLLRQLREGDKSALPWGLTIRLIYAIDRESKERAGFFNNLRLCADHKFWAEKLQDPEYKLGRGLFAKLAPLCGVTFIELAEAAELTQETISRICTGNYRSKATTISKKCSDLVLQGIVKRAADPSFAELLHLTKQVCSQRFRQFFMLKREDQERVFSKLGFQSL